MLGKTMRNIYLIFIVVIITGCSLITVSQREIRKSEGKWNASVIKNYNYTFIVASSARDDECSTPKVGIEIEVRDGEIKKFGTCDLDVEKALRFGTVGRIFATLRNEKSGSPPGLDVRFNEKYGYPEFVDINYSRWLTDHRVQYHILDFKLVM
jgi:hypothetical protein